MSSWYEQTRQLIDPIFDGITSHPFIKALMDGSLPKEVFEFYIAQDAIYLGEYKKTLATIGTRCQDQNDTQFYLQAATGILAVETALHQSFLSESSTETSISPTCELYISYLSRMANTQSLPVAMAAVLPCFTIYKEVGDYILANQTNKADNSYQNWINTYGGEAFANSVKNAVAITEKFASAANEKEKAAMQAAFVSASRMEWMFWDSAFNLEKWKI